ncbi:MAG: TlpA disulfide reductase family protein [Chitinophagaceae bacterium]
MKKILVVIVAVAALASCNDKSAEDKFTVAGTITNNPARVVYLEEIPMTSMQPAIVDSFVIEKNGKYKLQANTREATMYNLRFDQNQFPVAAVINDVSKVTLDITFSKENDQFAESYDVKDSKASLQMKNFMVSFNTKLQEIFFNSRQADSLSKAGITDSSFRVFEEKVFVAAQEAKAIVTDALKKSENPALSMFILSYYQSTANNPGYNLEPMDKQEVVGIVNEAAAKFSKHEGLASIQSSIQGMIGKLAPEISLPDANGNQVTLSSFKGKYVLVDFWASWCKPCRMENPNVVKAYNKFKDKNFTILGVSLDRPGGKDDWLKAIMQDNLTWTHVSDLQYWQSPVVPAYKIEGIPYNVLVGPDGKVIAEGLRGEDLERILSEVVK